MEKELCKPQYKEALVPNSPQKGKRHPKQAFSTSLDICEISAATFHLNLCRKETKLFLVSLYKID